MRFANPVYFLTLFVIPLFLYAYSRRSRIRFSSLDTLNRLRTKWSGVSWAALLLLRVVALFLFVTALARPQEGIHFSETASEGIDILLVIDTSESMTGLDFKIDGKRTPRLEVVKKVAADFVKRRPADRFGIVVFGEEAYTVCPLTFDHGVVVDFLSEIQSGMAGNRTAIGSGLGAAINRMKDLKAKSKVIILLTDGVNNAGRIPPRAAAEIALQYGIKVYTIGAGSKGQIPFRVDTPFGPQWTYREGRIDEEMLSEMAAKTKGRYFRATDTASLEEIYREIDRLEKTKIKVKGYTQYNELFHRLLIPGLIVVVLEIVLGNTLLRKLP